MKADSLLELFPDQVLDDAGPSLRLERLYWNRGITCIAGVDEAGRGSLSGPVVAAAVILPVDLQILGVADSKTLRPEKRFRLAEMICSQAVAVATGSCSPAEIDRMNILQAALAAMRRAVEKLSVPPEFVLIDGNAGFSDPRAPILTVIKGDARSHTIAAASIIAKTTRDAYMMRLHEQYPAYGWNTNMGYATRAHYEALSIHGSTPHHRQSFRLY